MPVTLSNTSVAAIIIIVVSAGIAGGIFHDQSIKTLYQSFSTQSAQDATLNSQNQQLQNQLRELQGLPKVTLVSGVITKYGAQPVYIFFDSQSGGPSLSSGVVSDTSSYQYQYRVYLGTGVTYGVRIYYSTTFGGIQSCAGVPVIIQPSGTTYTQDFSC